jgi:hypothetical protein
MTIQDYRQFLENKEQLTQNIVPLYQQEEDKLGFAKMKLLHLFFENGVQHNYNVEYLETLCSLLDQVCSKIFTYALLPSAAETPAYVNRLLHFALLPDLENLLVNLHFYEVIFSTLEEYEVCANIIYLQQLVTAEYIRKGGQELPG